MLGGPLGQGLGVIYAVSGATDFLLAQDEPDTALFEGVGTQQGILNATENTLDTALFHGLVISQGILAAIDGSDTALFNGTVEWTGITGKLIAKEASDFAWFVEGRVGSKIPSPVPQSPWDCLRNTPPRRRTFWTTQLEACGSDFLCGRPCAIPGLIYEGDGEGRTIITKDWLQSLILNILNTRARSDLRCPTPAGVYGHWSESYREDGIYVGAKFWNAAEKPYARIADSVKMIEVMVKSDLSKLVQMNVATSVDVEAVYGGSNQVIITVRATSVASGDMAINLAGAFVSSGWEWR